MQQKLFSKRKPETFEFIEFCGIMGMASFSDDERQIRNEFKNLKNI